MLRRYGDAIAVVVPYATFGYDIDLARYERLTRQFGVPVVVDAAASLGRPFREFTTDAGVVNEVVHMWRYADMGDRERRRAAMDADPEWQVFRKRTSHFVQSMRSRILRPTDFSPMR